MKYAVLFPGQGSQAVGMAADVRANRPDLLGQPANDVLGWDLEGMIANGPDEVLTETQHAQPALYATSYALFDEFMRHVDVLPSAAAGHSLGEYTALAAAGSIEYLAGLSLVSARGTAMAECAAASRSGMAALIGADEDTAENIARMRREDGGQLYVANLNAPGQIVLAGGSDDLEWLAANARDLGVRRAIILNVAGAFHSPFMAQAADALSAALDRSTFLETSFDVYANATALPSNDPRITLADQLTSSVRFSETLTNLSDAGVDTFVHVGPGDVTAGLVKRTVKGATIKVVSDLEQVRTVAEELSVQ
jgi:[acyl-carrier-protein] S-malonyltransferase